MQHIKSVVISRQRESEKRQIDGDLAHVALTLERRGWKEEEELMMANLERERLVLENGQWWEFLQFHLATF